MKTLLGLLVLFTFIGCTPSGSSSGTSAEVGTDALKGGERGGPGGSGKNTAPVVEAGSNIYVEDSDNNNSQSVQLQGSASDAQSNIRTYRLYRNGSLLVAGADASIFRSTQLVPVGSYEFKMEAIDSKGLVGSDSVIVTVRSPQVAVNTAPVVNAGADVVKTDAENNGSEPVTLAGFASDSQNNITSYKVFRNGMQVASSLTATITVPVGSHTIVMEAYDAGGLKGSDTMMITIKAPVITNTAPVVNAGADQSKVDSDNNGSESITLAGSASDAQNNITSYKVLRNGVQVASSLTATISVPVGSHTIVMEAYDAGGLKGSDTMLITVSAPAVTNTAPVVTVGPSISVTDTDKSGAEMVNISGAASDAQNNITVYRLYQNGTVIFSGPNSSIFNQSLNLAVGSHSIKLEAEDAGGLKGSGTIAVTVNPGPTTIPSGTPPRANAGADIVTPNIDPVLGIVTLTVTGSATAGSNPIVSYAWKLNGVPFLKSTSSSILTVNKINFPKGNNLLELEVTDSVGLKGIDSATVEIKPGLTDQVWLGRAVLPGVMSVSAGGDREFIDRDGNGMESVRMVGSVNSVNPIADIKWTSRGKILAQGSTPDVLTRTFSFPPGRHGITLTITDNKGNSMYDSFVASVSGSFVEQKPRTPSNFDINSYLVSDGVVGSSMWKDESAFRFRCKPSHISFDDPIVSPGNKGAAHMHLFFGNTQADANSTYDSLRASGDGSCDGGPNNRSAYWMPTVIDGTGKVVLPDLITIYYKRHPGSNRIPRGLKMVFGYDSRYPDKGHHGKWYCDAPGTTEGQKIVDVGNCPASTTAGKNQILARINSHSCWDGKNLDSPDHRSHMAPCDYSSGWGVCECPATHPVDIPAFTILAAFSHNGYADFSTWKLSSDHQISNDPTSPALPGGSTLHADWFGAWDDNVMDMWMDGCIDQFLSCSGGSLGLGKRLKENAGFSWVTVPNRVTAPVMSTSGTTTGSTSGGTTTGGTSTGGTSTGGTTTGGTTTSGSTSGGTTTGTAAVSTLGPNLITNSGFESGATGWSAYGYTVTTNSFTGTSALKFGVTGNASMNQKITVEPGQTYRITGYGKKDTNAGGSQLYYVMTLPDGTQKTEGRSIFTNTKYARLNIDVTIPAGVTSMALYFYAAVGTGGGSYLDDVTVNKITQAVMKPVLVSEGDSITATAGGYAVNYGKNAPDLSYYNSAVGGSGIAGINSRLPTVLSKKPASGQFVVTLLIGANDLGDPNLYASKIFAYADQVRAAGGKIYVATILPQTPGGATFNSNRKICNALIRQAVGTRIDGVIDFAADPIMGADATASNPVYFPDGLHPSGAGQEIMYWIYKAALDKAMGRNP